MSKYRDYFLDCGTDENCQQLYNETCSWQDDIFGIDKIPETMITDLLSIASYVFVIFFFYIFSSKKELHTHPTPLLLGITFSESFTYCTYSIGRKFCELKLPLLLSYTLFFDGSIQSQVRAQWVLVNSVFFGMISYAWFLSQFLITFLSIDMVLILKYPLSPKKPRVKYYYIISILGALTITLALKYETSFWPSNFMVIGLTVVYIFCGIFSIVYTGIHLCKKTVNYEVRRIIVARHMLFIICFNITNVIVLLPTIELLVNKQFPNWVWNLFYFSFANGLIYFIVRMFEPYAFNLMKNSLKELFYCGKKRDQVSGDEEDGSGSLLMMVLASSLNVELVYIVLKGLTKFGVKALELSDSQVACFSGKIPYESNIQTKNEGDDLVVTLSSVEIKDVDNWDVVRKKNKLVAQDMISSSELTKSASSFSHLEQNFDTDLEQPNRPQTGLKHIEKRVTIRFYKVKQFKKIFDAGGIDFAQLNDSLNPIFNRDMVFKAGEGAGASGSFFFFSHDQRFIIKTMCQHELDLFLDMLDNYVTHLQMNPDSLLAKIYGVFTIKIEGNQSINVILMDNTLKLQNKKNLLKVFDLKGSQVSREVKFNEGQKPKPSTTLKDLNLWQTRKTNPEMFGNFIRAQTSLLMKSMTEDVKFLKNHGLMDYSLLLAIEIKNETSMKNSIQNDELISSVLEEIESKSKKQAHCSVPLQRPSQANPYLYECEQYSYHISIIDYLQDWNFNKKAERFTKTCILQKNADLISAIEPVQYAKRFTKFMRDYVIF